jgi:ribosome-associated toxin RatA of RatAB toxin-antitoxin module
VRISESVVVPAPPSTVFAQIADLAAYPAWLSLVHTAEAVPVSVSGRPAWSVELRARVGPFARSKQLRMERCELITDQLAVFERTEVDGRRHARWALRAELEAVDGHATRVTMHLAYDGALWTGGLLERVLEEEIRRGRVGLVELLTDEPTH